MSRIALAAAFGGLLVSSVFFQTSLTSQTQSPARTPEFLKQRAEDFRKRSVTAETDGLADPFKGITANGQVEPGLFAIRSTGVTTEPVRRATDAFLAAYRQSLSDSRLWPGSLEDSDRMLHFFLLEKAFYEIEYELAHRPDLLLVSLACTCRILAASWSAPA